MKVGQRYKLNISVYFGSRLIFLMWSH